MGMIRYGHNFLEAAFTLYQRPSEKGLRTDTFPVPALYLVGRGLELTLKAFLLSKNEGHSQIRKDIGHDLEKAFLACKTHGLDSLFEINAIEESVLSFLNALYSTKELEYIVTGAKRVPRFPWLQNFAIRLFTAVAAPIGFPTRLNHWELDSPFP